MSLRVSFSNKLFNSFVMNLNPRTGGFLPVNPHFDGLDERLCLDTVVPINSNFNSSGLCKGFEGDYDYGKGFEKELLEKCIEHEYENSTPITKKNIIALTHPFYLQTSSYSLVDDSEKKREADIYLTRLERLLYKMPELRDVADFVLFDTPHHYASITSSLMESKIFNRTFFTFYDSGELLNAEDISEFSDKTWFTGGGYNARCYNQTNGQIRQVVGFDLSPIFPKIYPIHDLVINCPNLGDGESKVLSGIIDPKFITNGEFNFNNEINVFSSVDVLRLEELYGVISKL